MSEPILVHNCGSWSIKFALSDADVQPLPRRPLWSGSVGAVGKDKRYQAAPQVTAVIRTPSAARSKVVTVG
jgi:acetate kinase